MERAARALPTAPFAVNLTDGSFASSSTRQPPRFALFILARVFRHGAAMREDLEGTV